MATRRRRGSIVGPSDVEEYSSMIDIILQENEEKLERVAEKIRQDIVIPACERYGLEYISGMGTYFFSAPDTKYGEPRHSISTAEDARDARLPALAKVFDILEIEVGRDNYLGYYVDDVRQITTPSDNRRGRRIPKQGSFHGTLSWLTIVKLIPEMERAALTGDRDAIEWLKKWCR